MNYAAITKFYLTALIMLLTLSSAALANTLVVDISEPTQLTSGIATGYPPYQFTENERVTGFDADVARLIFARMGRSFTFQQAPWDTVLNELRFNKIDLIVGMEISEIRKRIFDFSAVYYHRQDVVFVLKENQNINKIDDLVNLFVAGDRHSELERLWKKLGILYRYRIISTSSKEQSMSMLQSGKISAAIMPKAVGLYLAKQRNIKIKIIEDSTPMTPVAVAVKKGNQALLNQINLALEQLQVEGEIEQLYQKWFSQSLPVMHKDTVNN
ncbi:transporter substrate-binding domain-containing protein [Shewanella mesophila]|uniref:transporter substrate-binding domain-containing protein n=1 Tax=Shewanella mesophila TaxID=2864208 RepID=UPI001C66022C|nr:transporter substrate-binding domain-containing protein [Shewanella mesophila]QYJ87344.1 transporter substrate-binding domain-containing protein [Shewanella mesophila]